MSESPDSDKTCSLVDAKSTFASMDSSIGEDEDKEEEDDDEEKVLSSYQGPRWVFSCCCSSTLNSSLTFRLTSIEGSRSGGLQCGCTVKGIIG